MFIASLCIIHVYVSLGDRKSWWYQPSTTCNFCKTKIGGIKKLLSLFPRKICIYSQCQINMTLQILRLLNFNMPTGILKDMEKEKILTKFKLEVHIQRTYYVASNWIWFVLTLNLLEIFRWEKNPDKNNFIRIRVCR